MLKTLRSYFNSYPATMWPMLSYNDGNSVVASSFVETLLFLSFFLSDSQNTRDYPKMLIFKGGTAISCGHIYACILEIHRNRPEMGV